MTLFAAIIAIVVALIAAAVALYGKILDRSNATAARHAGAREDAYDRLIAAGDAAWYYRTESAVEPNNSETIPQLSTITDSAIRLFQIGLDRLKEHSDDFEARKPLLYSWYLIAFEEIHAGPQMFENKRDLMVSQRRMESGLLKRIEENIEASFYERLVAGHTVQRVPEGIDRLLYFDDGTFVVTGSGDGFAEVMREMMDLPQAFRDSRQRAFHRLQDWQEREIWKPPPSGAM